jgi:succinyl-diaminopimelate desuccinylase
MSKDVLSIARKLVSYPSVTPKDFGCQDYLKSVLQSLGFEIFDLPFEGRGGTYPVQNFFARYGTSAPHICFAGHTDVVPPGDETAWSVPPFEGAVKDGKLIARGASDMKGQIAAFVSAVTAYLEEYPDNKASISFLITGDEEAEAINGTERVLEWMADNNHIPDVCLVGEPSNPNYMGEEIKIGRRGSLSGTLTVEGVQGHVAYPERADNPLPTLIKLVSALQGTVFDKGSAYFQQSNLEITSIDVGNSSVNVIPARGIARFNIRYSDRWNRDELAKKIRSVLDSVDTNYKLELTKGAECFLTAPGEWTAVVAKAVETITGHKPAQSTGGGTSDARFVAKYCPVVEFGMTNGTIHKLDEYCSVADLEQCASIYHEILKSYCA